MHMEASHLDDMIVQASKRTSGGMDCPKNDPQRLEKSV